MKKREAKKYQKLLLAEREHLCDGIRKIEEETLYESGAERSGDLTSFAEAGTDSFERETALNIVSGESDWLREVNDALQRIDQGTYGTCEGCEEDINVKRLEAFPSARYCIGCQEELEKKGAL